MPAITKTTTGNGANAVAETTLDGTDSFTYSASGREVLILSNPTAGSLSPVIDGDGATTLTVGGVGAIDVSGGYSVGAGPATSSASPASSPRR